MAETKFGKISRLIACILGLLGFSVIIAECLNSFELFDFRVKIAFVAVPLLLVFLLSELVHNILKKKMDSSAAGKKKYQRLVTIYNLILFLLFIALVVSIPFLWWGVIEKLAGMANQGNVAY